MNGMTSTVIIGALLAALFGGAGWEYATHKKEFEFYRDLAVENCRSLQSIVALLKKELPEYQRCRK